MPGRRSKKSHKPTRRNTNDVSSYFWLVRTVFVDRSCVGFRTSEKVGSTSKRRDQSRQQCAASSDVIDQDVLVRRMSTVAIDTQTIQHRRANGRRKVPIRSTTHLRLSQIVIQSGGNISRLFVKSQHLFA